MKKTLFVLFGLAVLAGCSSYDYYQGDVRYVQDGDDCIFYSTESGRHYSNDISDIDTDKEIVYRNTFCRDLYMRDTAGFASRTERQVLAPVAAERAEPKCNKCNSCVKTKKYIFVK